MAVIFGCFVIAMFTPWLYRKSPPLCTAVLMSWVAVIFLWFSQFYGAISTGQTHYEHWQWVPSLGIGLSMHLDALALLFVWLISGIGFFILYYASGYLKGDPHLGRLLAILMIFMGAMLGLVTSNNLISLFVFWELTSISSYLLIGYNFEQEKAKKSALQGLLVTVAGGLALMSGMILLGQIAGSYDIQYLLSQSDRIQASPLYNLMLVLIFLGALSKSAQFPLHFWLPNAMAAPTPISAYLHSATMVKAGIFLLARLSPALSGTDLWFWTLILLGGTTMLMGAAFSAFSADLKRILAYSTLMALGTLTLLLGIGSDYAIRAFVVFVFAHALYKGALFMAAGTLDHETGTRNVFAMGGLRHKMPLTFVFTLIAGLSFAGVPPLLGFVGKELLLEASLLSWALVALVALSSIFIVAAALKVAWLPFTGAYQDTPHAAHEAPLSLRLGTMILAILSLTLGLVVWVLNPIFTQAASNIQGELLSVKLSLWHGINRPLLISLSALILGYITFRWLRQQPKTVNWIETLGRYGPEQLWEKGWQHLLAFAKWQSDILQNGNLRRDIWVMIIVTLGLVGWAAIRYWPGLPALTASEWQFQEVAVAIVAFVAGLYSCLTRQRLGAVAALGALGFCVALLFVFFSAPDLAITQILIETLTVILLVLVLFRLPKFQLYSTRTERWLDASIALAVGLMMVMFILMTAGNHYYASISQYMIDNSYVIAKGRNIVNVILVDYRALDTLGEIFVLAIAAIGIYAMIRQPRELS